MLIHGLQKLTLLDFPGKVACTVFFDGCNFRCPFCHNSELLDGNAPAVMTDDELIAFLKKRKGLLEGVAFTGGEPLMQPGLPDLMRRIRELEYPIKLDTNGTSPEKVAALAEEGLLAYVAMDIKNSPERYAETAGVKRLDLAPLRETAALLLGNAVPDYEFRTTVVKEFHDDESFRKIAEWIQGAKRYFLQPFTDRDTVPCRTLHTPSSEDLVRWADIVRPQIPSVEIRGTSV